MIPYFPSPSHKLQAGIAYYSFYSRSVLLYSIAIMSTILFLFGLLLCQNSGEYWLQLFDSYSLNLALLWIALFHLIGMNFVYGTERYYVIKKSSQL
jgi:divalent metal cation (Fe/Co/Zn/Cd) transporter